MIIPVVELLSVEHVSLQISPFLTNYKENITSLQVIQFKIVLHVFFCPQVLFEKQTLIDKGFAKSFIFQFLFVNFLKIM